MMRQFSAIGSSRSTPVGQLSAWETKPIRWLGQRLMYAHDQHAPLPASKLTRFTPLFTISYSLFARSAAQQQTIVPHCFLREQGGKLVAFDHHIWPPFGKMQRARLNVGRQVCREMPFWAQNQWRGGRGGSHHATAPHFCATRRRSERKLASRRSPERSGGGSLYCYLRDQQRTGEERIRAVLIRSLFLPSSIREIRTIRVHPCTRWSSLVFACPC